MRCDVLSVDPRQPQPEVIARAAEVLRGGGLVAFPTETVYGLGANALDTAAVRRIFAAKGRPATNPLIVHVLDAQAARALAAEWPAAAATLAARFWPGPLTLVLAKRPIVPEATTGGGLSVALRSPSHPVARALIAAAGVPLAAPSANRSQAISATTAAHVRRSLGQRVDLILDGGPTPGGLESTVLDIRRDPPRLLRPGLLAAAELEAVLGAPLAAPADPVEASQPLPSPGLLSRHYAPSVPLECVEGSGQQRVRELAAAGTRVGWLTCGQPPGPQPSGGVVVAALPGDVAGYAARLYAALHELEEAQVERIVVALPPATAPWAAIHDRLRRASAAG